MKLILIVISLTIASPIFSQNDSSYISKKPLLVNFSPLFSPKHFGIQIGISKLLKEKEIHKKNSKVITKDQSLAFDLGFYSQKELHNSLFLTSSYTFRRINPHGFYRQLRPFLGIAQTFLNEESYSVNDKNEVILNKISGNFYLTGGIGFDLGKNFSEKQSKILRDVRIGLLFQTYYPNFKFIALRPAFQVGTSANLPSFSKKYKKKIIIKK
jgi:hypothetical protein